MDLKAEGRKLVKINIGGHDLEALEGYADAYEALSTVISVAWSRNSLIPEGELEKEFCRLVAELDIFRDRLANLAGQPGQSLPETGIERTRRVDIRIVATLTAPARYKVVLGWAPLPGPPVPPEK